MTYSAYLDNHTVTKPTAPVIHQWNEVQKERWGSLSTLHQAGQPLAAQGEKVYAQLLEMLGAGRENNFFYCHSGAEAVNAVLWSHYFEEMHETGKNHILASALGDADLLLGIKRLTKFHCVETLIQVNAHGQVTKEALTEAIKPRTSLVSLPWVNRLTGVIYPIEELGEVCRERGVRFHVDASGVVGKWFFRFDDCHVDYLTFDGTLIHAPQGTGGVLVKKGIAFHPLIWGLSGVNLAGASALCFALAESFNRFEHFHLETARLRNRLEKEVLAALPDTHLFFTDAERLPHTAVMAFPEVESEALLYLLSRKRVYASIGGGAMQKLFHVLATSGVDDELAHCAMSFSLSDETTEAEIDYAVAAIIECVQALKRCSQGGGK